MNQFLYKHKIYICGNVNTNEMNNEKLMRWLDEDYNLTSYSSFGHEEEDNEGNLVRMAGAKLFICFISDEEEQRMKNDVEIERARLLNKQILMIYDS